MNRSTGGVRPVGAAGTGVVPSSGQQLAGLNAIVTGASRGIGRAIALAYAAEGANVCLVATNRAALDETAALCAQCGPGRQHVEVLDVRERERCFDVVASAVAAFGGVDILVNASGVYRSKGFLDYEPGEFQWMLDVNVFGVINLMQAVLPAMIERRFGKIVNIASTAGKWASSGQSAYNVSKHAVVGLTRCVAAEMGIHGVCVNAICPGLVHTDMLDDGFGQAAKARNLTLEQHIAPVLARVAMRRVLQPDELSGLAVYLGSRQSNGMTGQSLVIDGGMLYV